MGVKRRRQVAVLGLGRFGSAVARELARLGHEVLAVDASEKIAQDLADEVTHAAQADITDEETLAALGLRDFDTVIVGVSSDLQASILATVLLRRLGVRRIVAKAANELHGSILQEVGADRVVYPERETGFRLAHSFAASGVTDYLDVAPDYGIARIAVAESWVGRQLGEVDTEGSCGVTVMVITRDGRAIISPPATERLRPGDTLIVAGPDENLERLPSAASHPKR
jgi:trk system potassium uptake protein TrkA